MRKRFVFMGACALLLVFSLAACSKNSEVEAFITELNGFTAELVKKIDANPTAAGIADAQTHFDAKQADVRAKFDGFKSAREFQVSKETRDKLLKSVNDNITALGNSILKVRDPAANAGVQKLLKDYQGLFAVK